MSTPVESKAQQASEDVELMRDTPLRYGGFADEIGEVMKPYTGEIGRKLGYGISGLYCLADLIITARQMNQKGRHLPDWERRRKVAVELLDLSIFHTVATMLIPPMLIGKVVSWAQKHLSPEYPKHYQRTISLLQISTRWQTTVAAEAVIRKHLHKPVPALLGLAMVPLVAHPFDRLMETVQDWTTRLLFKKHKLVNQPGTLIIRTDKKGQQQVIQLPDRLRSMPRQDYWLSKASKHGTPALTILPPAYHSSTHANCSKRNTLGIKQPKHFKSVFGEWGA